MARAFGGALWRPLLHRCLLVNATPRALLVGPMVFCCSRPREIMFCTRMISKVFHVCFIKRQQIPVLLRTAFRIDTFFSRQVSSVRVCIPGIVKKNSLI